MFTEKELLLGNGESVFINICDSGDSLSDALLIHGLFDSSVVWSKVAYKLCRNKIRVFAIDLPGHGKSKTDILNYEEFVHFFGDWASTNLRQRSLFVGHSFGTKVIIDIHKQLFKYNHTNVLISPFGLVSQVNRVFLIGVLEAKNVRELKEFLSMTSFGEYRVSEELLEGVLSDVQENRTSYSNYIDLIKKHEMNEKISSDFLKSNLPIMIIHGQNDEIVEPAYSESFKSQNHVRLIDNCGHTPHLEASKIIIDSLLELINI